MSGNPHQYKQSPIPTAELQAAIEKLKTFADQSHAALSTTYNFDLKSKGLTEPFNSPLEKTIYSIRQFFSSLFFEKESIDQKNEYQEMQKEVLRAIKFLKSNYLLILKLNQGTPEQQKLAASALSVIERYNQVVLQNQKNRPQTKRRFAQFFRGKDAPNSQEDFPTPLIDFPQFIAAHSVFSPKTEEMKRVSRKFDFQPHASSQKIESLIKQGEKEGFIMKAITLLQNPDYKNAFSSFTDLITTINKYPIEAVIKNSLTPSSKIVSMEQVLKTSLGEVLILTGEFERESQTSFPKQNSFHLVYKSLPSGFPHPSQHTGWGLSPALLPIYPQQLEQLVLLSPLIQKKNALAKALLPNGEFRKQAMALLALKKQGFDNHKENLLDKLLELHEAIISHAPVESGDKFREDIRGFFDALKDRENAYEALAETQNTLLDLLATVPCEKLQTVWVERSIPEFLSIDPERRYQAALSILEQEKTKLIQDFLEQYSPAPEGFEKLSINFILSMEKVLFKPFAMIILQHFSELMHFPPPILDDFEQKIQLCLYKQLSEFLDEFEKNTPHEDPDLMKEQHLQQIQSDLQIFIAPSFGEVDHPMRYLVHELEVYFNTRHIAESIQQT